MNATLFRRKAQYIRAIKWDGGNREAVVGFCEGMFPTEAQLNHPAFRQEEIMACFGENGVVLLKRMDGIVAVVERGDYIARTPRGDYEPFNAELFDSMFEPAESNELLEEARRVADEEEAVRLEKQSEEYLNSLS